MIRNCSPVSVCIRSRHPQAELFLPRVLLAPLLALLLAACATPRSIDPPQRFLDTDDVYASCARLFFNIDKRVAAAGVMDVQAAPIPVYPYLRLNRFLAAMVPEVDEVEKFSAWVAALRALDQQGRRVEITNLPDPVPMDREKLMAYAAQCGELLAAELENPEQRRHLRARARVPDDYSLLRRTFGLYPLTSLIFKAGVASLHRDLARGFAAPVAAKPWGQWRRYGPPEQLTSLSLEDFGKLAAFDWSVMRRVLPTTLPSQELAELLTQARSGPMGMYHLSPIAREKLFNHFAPLWEVDTVSEADGIGTPVWATGDRPQVDTDRPEVFRLVSQTRFEGEVLLQLNYMVWFPARPRTGPLDLLGGHLDGIVWRVTLDRHGVPLIYDSMHLCGCYHMFFPTAQLRQRPLAPDVHEEALLIPQVLPAAPPGRAVIRVAAGTHYLRRIYFEADPSADVRFEWRDYDELRSLPLPDGGQRSLFGPHALVAGSERRERWLFWPMGIVSPGAMRQWGHHATAFVGRRHFDEAELIGRYFERVREQE